MSANNHVVEKLQEFFPNRNDYSPALIEAMKLALEAHALQESKNDIHQIDSLAVMEILLPLNLDDKTYIATLASSLQIEENYPFSRLASIFDQATAQLIVGIRKLYNFKEFDTSAHQTAQQTERLRQMLLAMTSDIRIMLVKLGYRVAQMRVLKYEDEPLRRQIAKETQLIFAPLANRLGVAQLKWELEDLSFRFLEPEKYKSIANQLADKRVEREEYIRNFVQILNQILVAENIQTEIHGRPKHIFSIWKKMQKKHVVMDELYDLRAVRVFAETIEECYRILSIVHEQWNFIREEFDDYIASPKENGYQSIHTVVFGPEGKPVEIQIRTKEMHQNAEQGVAAHWKYKEGIRSGSKQSSKDFEEKLEASIANMRQLLESRSDSEVFSEISTELQTQTIFVFTPNNQIISLPQGATSLDFAYAIHTDLGHSCRGAKLNGRIIPLTQALKTGDRVEILAIKNGEPNRNWLNPNLGYIKTSRARTRIKGWFNKRNKDENIESGEQVLQRELKRLNARDLTVKQLVEFFQLPTDKDLFEALGKGQINERQLVYAIQRFIQPDLVAVKPSRPKTVASDENLIYPVITGAPNLRYQLAPCCEPAPGDQIVGYVTRGRGITIHRSDCPNILNLTSEEQQRLIEVHWSDQQAASAACYNLRLNILAFDRKGLLRDVMTKLTEFDVNLINSNTKTDLEERTVEMALDLEIEAGMELGALLDQIQSLNNIEEVSVERLSCS